MRKFILCLLTLILVGCGVETKVIKEADGDSKTYLFFKDFDPNNYYVELWDRNVNKNDDTRIIIARSDDKYYYEIDGANNMINIWKDGYLYTIDNQLKNYSKQESIIMDYSLGILPNDIKGLRTKGYETGEEKVYGKNYIYEKYSFDDGETTYYFSGKKLIYIKYEGIQSTLLYRFNLTKDKVSSNLFEIPDDYLEMTY